MGSKINHKCHCCQTGYYYCPTCPSTEHLETWHIMFHEENCKTIFSTCVDYFLNKITADEAAKILNECDLTNVDSFEKTVKDQVKTILSIAKENAEKQAMKKESPVTTSNTTNKKYNASTKKLKKG